MPLVDAGLGAAIKTAIITANGVPTDDAKLTSFCNALGMAIVEYIKANAIVTITQAIVTSGAGAGGTVTGTGTVS